LTVLPYSVGCTSFSEQLNKIDKTVWNKKNVQLAVVKVMIDFVLHAKSFSGTQTNIYPL